MIVQASDREDLIEASQSCRSCHDFGRLEWEAWNSWRELQSSHMETAWGLIDLGCESETKLRRTHDMGRG